MIENAYTLLFSVAFVVLGACLFLLILRSVKGPKLTTRVVCINMIGTTVTSVFALLAAYLREGWLYDICIVYVLISFLAVVILSKVYMSGNGKK